MRRNQLTWMAAVLGTVALTGMVGCGKGKTANLGAASISVGAAKLTLVDVKSVTVTISGGISTPLTVPLVGSGSQYSALVSDLPVGTNYTFTAIGQERVERRNLPRRRDGRGDYQEPDRRRHHRT